MARGMIHGILAHSKNCTPPHPSGHVHLARKNLPGLASRKNLPGLALTHMDAERKVQLTAIYKGLV
eukprot:3494886-Amphidinium_carterae.1